MGHVLPLRQASALDGIRDLDAYVNDAITRGLVLCNNARLDPATREEAHEYLKDQALTLAERFDPSKSSSFSKYAYDILPRRLIDWYRKKFGDSRYSERKVREVVSLEASADELSDRDNWMAQRWTEEVEFRAAFAG